MNDHKNSFQRLDEFIENHNAERKRYIPFLIVIIIGISWYISRDSGVGRISIGILAYRLIRYILN